MKVVSLTAENVKKLRAVYIEPKGNLVQITGRNGSGKTSTIDAIWWALEGTAHIQAEPIRKGETKARIKLDLGELIVERRFNEKGSTLTVESADGARYTSPQKMLDALLGALSFDPLEFVGQEPKAQFETLRKIVKLDIDPDQLDGLSRRDFDIRTDVKRDAKNLRAQAEGIVLPADLPAAPIDTTALVDEIARAGQVNGEIEARKARREQAAQDIATRKRNAERNRNDAAKLRADADALEAEAADYESGAAELQKKLDEAEPLPVQVDVAAARTKLDVAQAVNREIEKREARTRLIEQAEAKEAEAEQLTEAIDARNRVKMEAIQKAEMPVPGLGFGDGHVTFGGVPFEQASTAEQIRVSLAIAMANNPRLRVILIREGSMLDDENLALVAQMAAERDYQVFIERVDSTGKVGVYIEDGQVKAVDGEAPPPPKEKPARAAKAAAKPDAAKPAKPAHQEPLL